MFNLWVQTERPKAGWIANLTETALEDPWRLVPFLETVIRSGEKHRVLTVLRVASLNYERTRDGDFFDFLHARWRERGVPELLGDMSGLVAESRMAWLDNACCVTEGPLSELESILEWDEPWEDAIDGLRDPGWPPVSVFGCTEEYIQEARAGRWRGNVELQINLHSDIWMPWIIGSGHPVVSIQDLREGMRYFDNRMLAERHTPRLNSWIREVAAACVEAGGEFEVNDDISPMNPERITTQGIALDRPLPDNPRTLKERNASWD